MEKIQEEIFELKESLDNNSEVNSAVDDYNNDEKKLKKRLTIM